MSISVVSEEDCSGIRKLLKQSSQVRCRVHRGILKDLGDKSENLLRFLE